MPFEVLRARALVDGPRAVAIIPILKIFARRWMNAFGAHPLNSILPVAIDRCIAEREVALATVNRELAFLKRVFASR